MNGLLPRLAVRRSVRKGAGVLLVVAVMGGITTPRAGSPHDSAFTADNQSGRAQTINVAGFPVVAEDNQFFLDLGINGRRCVTCHQPNQNMTVTPARIRTRVVATAGTDPIFRTNDGSNSPHAELSTVQARPAAYSMLLIKGGIRVGLPIPTNAEFDLVDVRDPYGYASAAELSLFRRPLPATNLVFLSTVMWDGRETLQKGSAAAIHFDLADQSNAATQGHAQRPTPLDDGTRELIVAYELGLYTAQIFDRAAGDLRAAGAAGGPAALSDHDVVPGANDPLGCDPTGTTCTGSNPNFDPIVLTEYAAWAILNSEFRNATSEAVACG